MSERFATLLVWTLVGCSAGALGLRLLPKPLLVQAQTAPAEALASGSLERLLGRGDLPSEPSVAPQAPSDSRFHLVGLVAPRDSAQASQQGLALIGVDDTPPRALRVGQMVEGDLEVLKVEPHLVSLGRQGVVQVQLRLDPPAPAAQGSLPPAMGLAPPPQPAMPVGPNPGFAPRLQPLQPPPSFQPPPQAEPPPMPRRQLQQNQI